MKKIKTHIKEYSGLLAVRGFTLLEILVVMAIMSMFFSIGVFVSLNSYKRYVASSERDNLVTLLYKARSMAQNNIDGVPHGLHINNSNYVLFHDSSFNRGSLSNQITERSESVVINGLTEVIFEPLTGNPVTTGVINIIFGTDTKIITISDEGRINW